MHNFATTLKYSIQHSCLKMTKTLSPFALYFIFRQIYFQKIVNLNGRTCRQSKIKLYGTQHRKSDASSSHSNFKQYKGVAMRASGVVAGRRAGVMWSLGSCDYGKSKQEQNGCNGRWRRCYGQHLQGTSGPFSGPEPGCKCQQPRGRPGGYDGKPGGHSQKTQHKQWVMFPWSICSLSVLTQHKACNLLFFTVAFIDYYHC